MLSTFSGPARLTSSTLPPRAPRQHPTPSERSALKSYMHLFARLYPCGECAEEFQGLLREFPVQVSRRLGRGRAVLVLRVLILLIFCFDLDYISCAAENNRNYDPASASSPFPQTSSRKSASLWLCSMHNLVNARLGKEEFDCNMLEGTYDCGCGEEAEGDESGLEKEKLKVGEERVEADREEVKTAPRVEMW